MYSTGWPLGVQPPDLIGHGVKETMKRGRNGKKWQQKPGGRSKIKSGGNIRGPGLASFILSVRQRLSRILIGRNSSRQLTKVSPILPCAASNQRSLLSLYVFFPDERKSTWNKMDKVEFARSTCQFTTILVYIIATVSSVSSPQHQCAVIPF
jgi:hypothetical protein